MQYTWKVTGLKTRDQTNSNGDVLQNAVIQTYWEKTGVDSEGNVGTFYGATPLTAENIPAEQFVEFNSLTEEIVLQWIINATQSYEDHINETIQQRIDDKNTTEANLPWG